MTKLSIVLCTYNNSASLALTLQEIVSCTIPTNWSIELLCIDNNSPDSTQQIIRDVKNDSGIEIRPFFEEKQGLSHARNLGLSNSVGDYVLFTDDDAKIPKNWLISYCDKIDELAPDCLYSQISIIWDQPKPWWYIDQYRPFFVYLNYGNETLEISDFEHEFFGKNFCVRRDLLNEFGGFDPSLGRCGEKLIAGEETLIYKRLIKSNKKVIYFPEAAVGHRLKPREYELANIKKMYSDSAYSLFHISKMTSSKKIMGRPIYPLKYSLLKLPLNLLSFIANAVIGNRQYKVYHQLMLMKTVNTIKLWIQNP
jgi:glycosyltransferase involved in cell wall biosynthesis